MSAQPKAKPLLYRITHTYPSGDKSVFLVERGNWERWEAWRDALDERLARRGSS